MAADGRLTIRDHDRDAAGMRYLYPVASRRAGGLSVGVNLNPNNACNWRCCYCQVPDLRRGRAPRIDLALLEAECGALLREVVEGDLLARRLPPGMQRLCDVALSGNGEPTSTPQFPEVVALLAEQMERFGLDGVPLRLITNGSYAGKRWVQRGVARMAARGGEVWAKVDAGGRADARRINGVSITADRVVWQVERLAARCPTWVQSCMVVASDGAPPGEAFIDRYLRLLERLVGVVEGVLLYAPARPSHQERVAAPPRDWLDALAGQIGALGLAVRVVP
ncbi:MAG: radical SAM protein [Zetaproteobacteria bacterium]|nr:MAG: radical SAM protein [Zetaproteobacteria bacterium]